MGPYGGQQRRPARRFEIRQADPRAVSHRSSPGPSRTRARSREQTITRLHLALQRARDNALARGTKITQKSQLSYWAEFCSLFDCDQHDFGRIAPGQSHPSLEQVRTEEDVLAAFMAFVIACPRKGLTHNTATYAIQCISAVRSYYALLTGRRPGLRDGNRTGGQLRTVIRGFQRTHPAPKRVRMPILQQHLRALRRVMDLQGSRYHKALWALWLTQWQGVLRSSDLIKKKREGRRPWLPSQETHRGRLSVDLAKDLSGRPMGARIKLLLKPNKTDQSGEKHTIKSFIIDQNPEALSAGQAIRQMLTADPLDNGLDNTPLFRNPDTGKEITYEESHQALHRYLALAGFSEEVIGTHSLRIGGATAYANAHSGGYAVSGFMGLWTSPSRDGYLHACAPRLDVAALEIGRAAGWKIAGRPGPVARYAV